MRDRRIVVWRLRIWHRRHRRKATGHGCAAARRDGFGFFGSGLAQVDVDIKKTRGNDKTCCIEYRKAGYGSGSDRLNLAAANDQVCDCIDLSRWVDKPAVRYDQFD